MTVIKVIAARAKLYSLIDETSGTNQPIVIAGKRNNAVLIAESDWNAIQETLYLLSIPGVRESIRTGLNTDISEYSRDLDLSVGTLL